MDGYKALREIVCFGEGDAVIVNRNWLLVPCAFSLLHFISGMQVSICCF